MKVRIITYSDQVLFRIPAWINYAIQDDKTKIFDGCFWNPPVEYVFKYPRPVNKSTSALLIYETHVGMAGVEPRCHTYVEFENDILPMIVDLGYNAIQVMAIMEHAYYASFGYQVTNFFATSSRFGTPEQLKSLIDKAHSLGLQVFLDLIHSHASKNVDDGINQFDGTDHWLFHEGGKGVHPLWDSRLFNYNHIECQRFLLSNLKYYLAEFHFDGFRFDGVTSILYLHHGNLYNFTSIDDYFNKGVDWEAVTYLMLANATIHEINPEAVSIAEEVSGYTGLARRIEDGGIGFDYRLAMATPDLWIKLLKEFPDDKWDTGIIAHTLTDRPYREKTVSYCESHDQALVGDKTIAFWLMDKEMYDFMTIGQPSDIIDRGLVLHKMIRLLTFGLGGEAYLTFMGNEFGHPEWIDFPRLGNNWSYHLSRRRFDLAKSDTLKYKYFVEFDKLMLQLEKDNHFLGQGDSGYVVLKHQEDKLIVFERGQMLFVFNFHITKSFPDYFVGIWVAGTYKVILSTDDKRFGGFGRLNLDTEYQTLSGDFMNRRNKIQLYIPNRSAFVLKKVR